MGGNEQESSEYGQSGGSQSSSQSGQESMGSSGPPFSSQMVTAHAVLACLAMAFFFVSSEQVPLEFDGGADIILIIADGSHKYPRYTVEDGHLDPYSFSDTWICSVHCRIWTGGLYRKTD